MASYPTPPPLNPAQCKDLESWGLWENVLTNILYLFPAVLCWQQGRTKEALVIVGAMLCSFAHHYSPDVKLWQHLDVIMAYIASAVLFRIFLKTFSGWNANNISFVILVLLGFITFVLGANKVFGPKHKTLYIASHSLWHCLTALGGLVLLLPNP